RHFQPLLQALQARPTGRQTNVGRRDRHRSLPSSRRRHAHHAAGVFVLVRRRRLESRKLWNRSGSRSRHSAARLPGRQGPAVGFRARPDGTRDRELRRRSARLHHASVPGITDVSVTRERLANAAAVICDVAAFAIPTAIYVASASHEPASWDTAELQGVPYILGISHPTGFPFFVLLGYVWSHVVAVGSVAFRMNAMSAVCIGIADVAAYAVALRLKASRPI